MNTETETTTMNKTDIAKLKVGDRLSRVSYVQIVAKTPTSLRVRNQDGLEWEISSNIVAKEMFAAGQYTSEKAVSRTEMIEALEGAADTNFTIVFEKQVAKADVAQTLVEEFKGSTLSTKDARNLANKILTGEARTLIGYLVNAEPKMGRSTVVDLEATGHNLRLVDHRTISELILRNVRYTLK